MFVGESKSAERLESDFNRTFIALTWEIPNSNWEQLNIILINWETKSLPEIALFRRIIVLRESCAGPAAKYSIFKFRGAKKSSSEKTDRNSQCR